MYFDPRRAKALKPGESYAIDGCPGLRLEAAQTRKTWTYRYRSPINDKLKQVKVGLWPAMPPAEAAGKWADLRDRRDRGEDPAQEKRQARYEVKSAPDATYTYRQMVDDYYREHLKVNRKLRGANLVYGQMVRAIADFEDLEVSRTSRRFVHDHTMSRAETPVLAVSVKGELGAAWELAVNAGRVSEDLPNWWRQVKILTLRSKGAMRAGERKGTGKRVLKPEEIQLLYTDQMRLFSQQVQDFLALQMWTCARGGEICQMQRSQLRREDDGILWWTVPKELLKTGRFEATSDYRVPLLGRAESIVERLLARAPGPWLFHSKTRGGEPTHVKQPYMQSKVHYRQPYSNARPDHVRERLKVTHWSPHDLRRTGRTMLASLRCPKDVAEAIIGHVKPGVEGTYNLYEYDAEKVEWLTLLGNRLDAIVTGGPSSQCSQEAGGSTRAAAAAPRPGPAGARPPAESRETSAASA